MSASVYIESAADVNTFVAGGKTLEQVDYLFIERGFAGLRKNFDVTPVDMEYAVREKPSEIERRDDASD